MIEEFCLSDKIIEYKRGVPIDNRIKVSAVKEFIKILKEELFMDVPTVSDSDVQFMKDKINKLAGPKLTEVTE